MAWQFKIQKRAQEIANIYLVIISVPSGPDFDWVGDVIDDRLACYNDYLESSSISVLFSIHLQEI